MEIIEKTAETVEKAVALGVKELGVDASDVMVEVLEEPSGGLLGIGARPARVRIVLLGDRKKPEPESSPVDDDADFYDDGDETPSETDDFQPSVNVIDADDANEDARVGKQVIEEILDIMGFDASVEILKSNTEGDDNWVLNIKGRNMRKLIGRRGETLAAMQYLVRLISSRRLERRSNISIDVDHYRSRRSERLQQLANRMADQAVRQDRKVVMEPMPAHERRIIHITLRERNDVITESVGEGRVRKVTILPVSNDN